MIDGRGRVRITDFGLAVAEGDETPAGDVSGTPAYMAPEQLAGKGAKAARLAFRKGLALSVAGAIISAVSNGCLSASGIMRRMVGFRGVAAASVIVVVVVLTLRGSPARALALQDVKRGGSIQGEMSTRARAELSWWSTRATS